jgi:hypothetical protein
VREGEALAGDGVLEGLAWIDHASSIRGRLRTVYDSEALKHARTS